jgi:2-desacetyl-2-hydroxyethyl bacteriochlorophyllide A dehydrogenase
MMATAITGVKTMKAAVYNGPHDISVNVVPYPKPGPEEVTVKVAYCGICGTDYHIVEGDFISPYPLIGGHEFSGTIFEVGEGVKGWEAGDRVVVAPSIYCGKCFYCQNDQFNHCENLNSLGVTINGGFAEYVKVPVSNLYQLSETLTFEEGALVEPMACVAYGLERLQPKFGDKAVIFGAGPMGMLLLQSLKTSGASEVIVVDIAKEKLEMAMKNGASAVYLNDDRLEELIGRKQYPHGFDIVIDATGIPKVIERMFRFAGAGAGILQFGVAANNAKITINPFELYHKDWKYIGTMAYQLNFHQAINMIAGKKVDTASLVTKKISLEEFATYMTRKKNLEDCKVLVDPSL